jgi:CheY-like chemotaxis protein
MPAGDGATAYSRLRGNTFTVATPIIFISGINPGEILSRLPKDPLVRVITKPIDMDELSKHIAELLGLPPPTGGPSKEAAPPKPRGFDGGSMGGDILDIKL